MSKALSIRVHGRVQGVNFRYYTRMTAYQYNVQGFVRNEPDGSVYIEAEGEEEELNMFLAWCYDGPSWARVDKVETQKIPAAGYEDFVIKS
jgi:acylphosphatase